MITFEPLTGDAKAFLSARTGINFMYFPFLEPQWICATSRSPEGDIDGVLTGEFTTPYEVHMSCAVDNPAIITRRLLHAIFTTFFSRAVRVTALSRPDNQQSIWGIQRLGFKYEGFIRMGIEGRWDAMMFGMLRSECRWIRAPRPVELAKVA